MGGEANGLQRFWWTIAVSETAVAAGLYIMLIQLIRVNKNIFKKGHDFFLILSIPMIVADFNLILNHFFRDFFHLIINDIPDDTWCQVASIWAIATLVAMNMHVAVSAYYVREMTADRLKRDALIRGLLRWTLASWSVGIIVAAFMKFYGATGPFNGLYCCVNTYAKGGLMGTYCFFVAAIVGSLAWNLNKANEIAMHRYKTSAYFWRQEAKEDGKKALPQNVQELQRYAQYIIFTYIMCWFWVGFFGFLAVFKVSIPQGLDAFAGIMLKLQPIVNIVILYHAAINSLRTYEVHVEKFDQRVKAQSISKSSRQLLTESGGNSSEWKGASGLKGLVPPELKQQQDVEKQNDKLEAKPEVDVSA